MERPFRFGVRAGAAESAAELVATARRAEALGYHSVLYTDHYLGPGPAMDGAQHPPQPLAAIPSAVAAALATTNIRVGFRVLCIDYHNPVVLAKELATLDVLSDGRLEVGLGAGWIRSEYDAMGVAFDRPGVRIRRLEQVVSVLQACFAGGQVDISGDTGVTARGFEGLPRPVQKPGPPIAIGGGGRNILTLAARRADIVAFNFNNSAGRLDAAGPRSSTAELTDERIGWVREAAAVRPDGSPILEIGIAGAVVASSAAAGAEQLKGFFALEPPDIIGHPHALVGTIDEICDQLRERRARYGFSYVTIRDRVMDAFAPVVERLAGS